MGELCAVVAELLGDAKIHSLAGPDRRRARDALRTVKRSSLPQITRDMLVEATWAAPLVELARRDTDTLARFLGRQKCDAYGQFVASDAILTALRDLDRAVLDLSRRLDRSEFVRAQFGNVTLPQRTDEQAARETLHELGIGTIDTSERSVSS